MKEKQTNPAVCGRSTVGHPKTAKRILALLLTFAMLATTLCLPAFAVDSTENSEPVAEQTGEEVEAVADDVIEISDEAGFLAIADDLTGNYKLVADIELSEVLGAVTFTGTLDGDGHTVTFSKTFTDANITGVMGTTFKGTLKDITFEGLKWTPSSNVIRGGGISQQGGGTYENVHLTDFEFDFKNNTRTASSYVGGFVGQSTAAITATGCTVSGRIYSSNDDTGSDVIPFKTGGFLGNASTVGNDVTLTDCISNVEITDYKTTRVTPYQGGLVGGVESSVNVTLENCVNNGAITSSGRSGGFIGEVRDKEITPTIEIINCVNNGAITNNSDTETGGVGGFVGYAASGSITIENCVNTGDVTVSNKVTGKGVGGFVGNFEGTSLSLENAVNLGNVTGADGSVGSMIGKETVTATKTDCVNFGTVNGESGLTVVQANKGAGVRIHNTADESGLRFKFTMDETSIANLDLLSRIYGKDNVQVGAIFLPTDLLLNGELTEENYSNALTMAGSASEVTDGYYHASLVKLYDTHYNTEYSCQSFWRFKTSADGEWITVYANNTLSKTVASVAADALDDPNKPSYSAEQTAILNAYAGRTN